MVIDSTGVMPLPPQKAMIGRSSSSPRQNAPEGGDVSTRSPTDKVSLNQLDTEPPGTRLTVTARSESVSGALDME